MVVSLSPCCCCDKSFLCARLLALSAALFFRVFLLCRVLVVDMHDGHLPRRKSQFLLARSLFDIDGFFDRSLVQFLDGPDCPGVRVDQISPGQRPAATRAHPSHRHKGSEFVGPVGHHEVFPLVLLVSRPTERFYQHVVGLVVVCCLL